MTHAAPAPPRAPDPAAFQEALGLIERLYRLQLDLVKDEFERLQMRDINPVQGMLLFHVAHRELTAGEVRRGGFYQGSNLSYNLRRLVALGYMRQRRSERDGRALRVSLTERGRSVEGIVAALLARHGAAFDGRLSGEGGRLCDLVETLSRLERYLTAQIRYIY